MAANAIDIEQGRHAVELAKSEWGEHALKPIAPHMQSLIADSRPYCTVGGDWYVVSTEPKHESMAMGEIAGRGLVTYLPIVPKEESHGRGSVRLVERPMFPSYLFVRCFMTVDNLSKIVNARGVGRLLGIDGKPSVIPEAAIEVIRLNEAQEAELEGFCLARTMGGKSGIVWEFSPEDKVRITDGPFAAFNAQLKSAVDSNDRLKALVNVFGRQSLVELSAFDIEAL